MSPGIQDTTLLEFNSDSSSTMLRMSRRELCDGRAVGGHLSLSKRNSTPVGANMTMAMLAASTCTTNTRNTTPTPEHRRLDRCHSEPSKGAGNSSRYKTELCRPFEEHGYCKYGDKCQFAHGGNELRTLSRHPKYKTELCRTFHTIGFCPYGPRCHFIHNAEERRGAPPPASPSGASKHMLSLGETPSPPSSLHGSPTTPNAFFDDSFSLFPRHGLLEGLSVGLSGLNPSPASPSPGGSLPALDTPPISPVESLAGDLDSLSLSSSHSASPTPHTPLSISHSVDISRSLRLPIFEQLCEHD